MNHLREERLKTLLRYLGNGDLKTAKVWFFGIEEAQPWKDENINEIYELKNNDSVVVKAGRIAEDAKKISEKGGRFTDTYGIMSKIILGLKGESWTDKEWESYRNTKLFTEGSEAFQGNLYPLGKKSIDTWPTNYENFFGLNKDKYYELMSKEETGRFAYIRAKRETHMKPLTFCFGSSFWHEFIRCFNLENILFSGYQNLFRFYTEERIILTPFFWYGGKSGMTNERIEKLIEITNVLGINSFR